jgi:hypothetical protein
VAFDSRASDVSVSSNGLYEHLGVSFDSATPSPTTPVLANADDSDDVNTGDTASNSSSSSKALSSSGNGVVSPSPEEVTPTKPPSTAAATPSTAGAAAAAAAAAARPPVPPADYPVVMRAVEAAAATGVKLGAVGSGNVNTPSADPDAGAYISVDAVDSDAASDSESEATAAAKERAAEDGRAVLR